MNHYFLLLLIGTVLLTACGGGGSSSNTPNVVVRTFLTGSGFTGSSVQRIVEASDGSGDIYVAGQYSSYNNTTVNTVVRLNDDGSIDPDFDSGTGSGNAGILALAVATDGSGDIYLGGDFLTFNGTTSRGIIRLNNDGSVDSSFNVGAGFSNNAVGFNAPNSIVPALDGSGDVYVAGEFTTYNGTDSNYIIRLNEDGSIDTGFNVGTGFNVSISTRARSIAAVPDGSGDIYVGGNFTSYNGTGSNGIIRLNSDGSIENSFSVGSGFDGEVISLAIDNNGDIYAAGSFTVYRLNNRNGIARINSDGSNDAGFNIGTGFNINSFVLSVVLAPDTTGDVIAGGIFTTFDGAPYNRIIRLNPLGMSGGSFDNITGFDNGVNAIFPRRDNSGDIYVGGRFGAYNGETHNRLIRLNAMGLPD